MAAVAPCLTVTARAHKASRNPRRGHGPVEGFYRHLFDDVTIDDITRVHRLHGPGSRWGESVLSLTAKGKPLGLDGQGRRVAVPILHVFEVVDGKITREPGGWIPRCSPPSSTEPAGTD